MRLHVSAKQKDIVIGVAQQQGISASRAMAYIVNQWYLTTHNNRNKDGNRTRSSKKHQD